MDEKVRYSDEIKEAVFYLIETKTLLNRKYKSITENSRINNDRFSMIHVLDDVLEFILEKEELDYNKYEEIITEIEHYIRERKKLFKKDVIYINMKLDEIIAELIREI